LGYTLPQVRGFLAAVERREAKGDARLLSLIAVATRSEPKHLERMFDRLAKVSEKP